MNIFWIFNIFKFETADIGRNICKLISNFQIFVCGLNKLPTDCFLLAGVINVLIWASYATICHHWLKLHGAIRKHSTVSGNYVATSARKMCVCVYVCVFPFKPWLMIENALVTLLDEIGFEECMQWKKFRSFGLENNFQKKKLLQCYESHTRIMKKRQGI